MDFDPHLGARNELLGDLDACQDQDQVKSYRIGAFKLATDPQVAYWQAKKVLSQHFYLQFEPKRVSVLVQTKDSEKKSRAKKGDLYVEFNFLSENGN